jgi:hypothetical protein
MNQAKILDFNRYKALKEDIPVKVTTTHHYDLIEDVVSTYHLTDVFDESFGPSPFCYVGLDLNKIKETVARQGWYKKLYCGSGDGELMLEFKVERVND